MVSIGDSKSFRLGSNPSKPTSYREVVQLVRILVLGTSGRQFESDFPYPFGEMVKWLSQRTVNPLFQVRVLVCPQLWI